MVLLIKNGSPNPEVLSQDQIPGLKGVLIGMAVYGWIFFTLTLVYMKPVRTSKWWLGALINICCGISTCILTPFCIQLALKWNSKEVKDYFSHHSFEL
jgi:hypothetical protein